MDSLKQFESFVRESNRIERIFREPTGPEVTETGWFITSEAPSVESLCALALVYAPRVGYLRERAGMDVRAGGHIPPRGGKAVRRSLNALLRSITDTTPFECHRAYESLHPFMDGNGRTGRALWAWQMAHRTDDPYWLERGFLHTFYYQTLAASEARK